MRRRVNVQGRQGVLFRRREVAEKEASANSYELALDVPQIRLHLICVIGLRESNRVRCLSQAVRGMKMPFGFVCTSADNFPSPVRCWGWYGFQ